MKRQNSGQVLIIISLVITVLLLSTAAYVIEIEKNTPAIDEGFDTSFSNFKLGALHTITNSLANITNGGEKTELSSDLARFDSLFSEKMYLGIINSKFLLLNQSAYENGTWISWDSSGLGISSAYVNFALNYSSLSSKYYSEFAVNITSAMAIQASYITLANSTKQITVNCSVSNEGEPSAAQSFVLFYESGILPSRQWVEVASPSVAAYGNGTYRLSVLTDLDLQDSFGVAVVCKDMRGIIVSTNSTCTRVG